MPRLIFTRNALLGTVCRFALPATPRGDYVPPSGARPPTGLAREDPRWTRRLPWTNLMAAQTARTGLLAVVGLALVNVFLPLGILRLAAPAAVESAGPDGVTGRCRRAALGVPGI